MLTSLGLHREWLSWLAQLAVATPKQLKGAATTEAAAASELNATPAIAAVTVQRAVVALAATIDAAGQPLSVRADAVRSVAALLPTPARDAAASLLVELVQR